MPAKTRRPPSLHEHAMYNSFYAKQLMAANRRIHWLKRRIAELEGERRQHIEQMVRANMQIDTIMAMGHEEQTLRQDIRTLQAQKDTLELEIHKLKDVVQRIKRNLREGFKRN